MRRTAAVVVGAALVLGGCGSSSGATSGDGPARYGAEVHQVTTSTTLALVGTSPSTTSTTARPRSSTSQVPVPATSPERVANRTQRQDDSGFFLTLVAGGNTTFSSTQDVDFELTFENRSSRSLFTDPNQSVRFRLLEVTGDGTALSRWDNDRCGRTGADPRPPSGPLTTEPGESASFIDEYPMRATSRTASGPDPNSCRVAPGSYLLVGYLDWCPEDTLAHSDYNGAPYCDRAKVRTLASSPLRLTFTAS